MRLPAVAAAVCALLLPFASALAEEDCENCKDLPYLTRMPGYRIGGDDESQFNEQKFYDGKKIVTREGARHILDYFLNEGKVRASALQIMRNYGAAIRKAKGKVYQEGLCKGEACEEWAEWPIVSGSFTFNGKETWVMVEVHDDGNYYKVYAVDIEKMKQDVEVTADTMKSALDSDGRVALDVHFETGKAILMADASTLVGEIVKLLQANATLRLSIEGHTDNTGNVAGAQKLSEARAQAVQAALIKEGIAKTRLTAKGFGQSKPVADNGTDEGRAKNRRVELVKVQ